MAEIVDRIDSEPPSFGWTGALDFAKPPPIDEPKLRQYSHKVRHDLSRRSVKKLQEEAREEWSRGVRRWKRRRWSFIYTALYRLYVRQNEQANEIRALKVDLDKMGMAISKKKDKKTTTRTGPK